MAKTLTKNEKEWMVAKRICKVKQNELLSLESVVADQLASKERKAWKRFDRKNKTLIEEVNKLLEEENKIHRRVLSAKQRMRAKYATSEA
jgi:peptidoglycan hydrolase CwlO-like protein